MRTLCKYDMNWQHEEIVEKRIKQKKQSRMAQSSRILQQLDSCPMCFDSLKRKDFVVYQTQNLYVSIPQRTQLLLSDQEKVSHLTIIPKNHHKSFLEMDPIIDELR